MDESFSVHETKWTKDDQVNQILSLKNMMDLIRQHCESARRLSKTRHNAASRRTDQEVSLLKAGAGSRKTGHREASTIRAGKRNEK